MLGSSSFAVLHLPASYQAHLAKNNISYYFYAEI